MSIFALLLGVVPTVLIEFNYYSTGSPSMASSVTVGSIGVVKINGQSVPWGTVLATHTIWFNFGVDTW